MSLPTVELISTITCPHCGVQVTEVMAEDSCRYFYRCSTCDTYLKPRSGDCCVFCSYGSVPCPPKQRDAPGCS